MEEKFKQAVLSLPAQAMPERNLKSDQDCEARMTIENESTLTILATEVSSWCSCIPLLWCLLLWLTASHHVGVAGRLYLIPVVLFELAWAALGLHGSMAELIGGPDGNGCANVHNTCRRETNLEERYGIRVAVENADGQFGNRTTEERLQQSPVLNNTETDMVSEIPAPEAAETFIQKHRSLLPGSDTSPVSCRNYSSRTLRRRSILHLA
ncbi:hypothetical protein EJB05_47400, partial [Eragrostis curvula]